jgi:hypothetical protein
MSQFAELFKAVKSEPKDSPEGNENKKLAAVKDFKHVKAEYENGEEDKSGEALNSAAQNLKKGTQVFEKAGAVGSATERLLLLQEEPKIVAGSPKKPGKSRNTDFTQVLTYIRRDTHRQTKKVLIDDPDERDLSDLVEELLSGWLKKNV